MSNHMLTRLAALSALCVALAFPAASSGASWRDRASGETDYSSGDVAAEISFGREIAARILGRYKDYDNAALLKYVNLVGLSLTRNANRPELEFHFMVLDTDEVNAYATPGGYIFVTRGALRLMKDEDELAGVLAHEIGHVSEKHVVKELKIKGTDDSATTGLAQLVGSNTESAKAAFSQAVDKGLEMIFTDGYKREDEMQADRDSVMVSAITGYDATGLARYLDRLRPVKEKGQKVDDDIHPSIDARIKQINDVVAENGMQAGGAVANQNRFALAMKGMK